MHRITASISGLTSNALVSVVSFTAILWRLSGPLNLFGFEPKLWDTDAETTGMVLAAHAAAAILASREGDQLQSALSTRDRIGQAKGIIMERFKIDDVQAFGMLRQLSQDTNTKLIDIAQRVIDTRNT